MSGKAGFRETLAPPLGRTAVVDHPPGLEEHESKRTAVVFTQESEMVGAMQELRIQTVEKNAEFEAAVTALHQRVDVAWDKLRQEVDQRSKQFDAVRDLVSSSLLDLGIRHRQQFDARMTNVEESGRSAANIKCSQLCAAERKAYFEEVPDLVQRLIGPARSQMQTSHESFEVENTKVMAREERLKDKVETFNTATQQRVGIECEDRLRQFHMAAEQLSSQLLLPVRLDRQRQRSTVMHGVKDIQNALTAETAAREQGDGFIADSLTRATRSLQQTVLENFGSVDHTDSSDSDGAESGSDSD